MVRHDKIPPEKEPFRTLSIPYHTTNLIILVEVLCTVLQCCHLKSTSLLKFTSYSSTCLLASVAKYLQTRITYSLDNGNTNSFNQSFATFFVLESRKKASEPKTSKSSKRKCPSDAEFQDSPPGSSDDSASCSKMPEASSSTASSSALKIKGSNALM